MKSPTTTRELLEALGRHLAFHQLVQFKVGDDAHYTDNPLRPAYFYEDLPDKPATAVSAKVYNDTRDRDPWNPDVYVRLRWRAKKNVDDLADKVHDVIAVPEFYYRPQTWPGGVRVIDVRRVVRAESAQDSNNRWMRADSYRITLNPPGEIS